VHEADERSFHLDTVKVEREDGVFVVRAVIFSTNAIDAAELNALQGEIEEETGMDVRLETRVLRMDYFVTGSESETPAEEPATAPIETESPETTVPEDESPERAVPEEPAEPGATDDDSG
jgi:hypothetical protein